MTMILTIFCDLIEQKKYKLEVEIDTRIQTYDSEMTALQVHHHISITLVTLHICEFVILHYTTRKSA